MANTFVLATLILLALSSTSSSSACNKQDEKAILAFKNSFPPNTFPTWTNSESCCSWDYVECDNATGRIKSLTFGGSTKNGDIRGNYLIGSIPASIGNFPHLENLAFTGHSRLVGPIPPQLSKLTRLRSLIIYGTSISGPIPPSLSQLSALTELELSNNGFQGPIPASLGKLANLTYINLSRNQLSGSIPATLFSRAKDKLPTLSLAENRLTGGIPRSFGEVGFYNIDLGHNHLTGDASFLFGKSKPLWQIALIENELSFNLTYVEYPETNLDYVLISHNEIYGSISEQITKVPNLRIFDVSHNKLCGKIPSGGNMGQFAVEDFADNKCLCGAPLPPCK